MATRTAVASGAWNTAGTWDTGVPVNGDTAVIPLAYDVEFNADQSGFASGVTVTLNGTLHASTTAGSYVLKLAANMTGSGTLRAGTSGTPYPTNCTFTINRNGFQVTATSMILDLNCSEPTIKYCKLSAVEAAGQTVLSVDTDLTGFPAYWYDGAIVRIDDNNKATESEERIIAVGGIAASTITITSGLTAQKEIGAYVILISRNVKIIGTTGTAINGGTSGRIFAEIRNAVTGISAGTGHVIGGSLSAITSAVSNGLSHLVSSAMSGNSAAFSISGGYSHTINDAIISGCSFGFIGGTGVVLENTIINGCDYMSSGAAGTKLLSCDIGGCANGLEGGSGYIIIDCSFSNNTADLVRVSDAVLVNTILSSTTEFSGYNSVYRNLTAYVESVDHDQVAGAYKAWTRGGIVTKQSTTYPTGYTYSFDHALESATYYCFWQRAVTVPAGGGLVVECLIRKDASMSYLPRLWLLLPGVEPLISGSPSYEAIMTNSVDTWETLLLVYANATSADAQITVRTIGQNATGHVYALPIVTVLAPATYDVYSTLQADLDDIQNRIPATLEGGRMPARVGAMADDVITAAALSAGAVAEIQNGLSTLTLSDIMDYLIETGLTFDDAIKLIASSVAGTLSGAGTNTVAIKNAVANNKTRITASVDSSGNRTAITYDLS